MERLRDACGVVGIYAQQNDESIDVRRYLTLALTALQHRGQESAGMAVYNTDGSDPYHPANDAIASSASHSGRMQGSNPYHPANDAIASSASHSGRMQGSNPYHPANDAIASSASHSGRMQGSIAHRVGMGKVREVFPDGGTELPVSCCGIGHVRYSTTGSSCVENAGPFVVGGTEHFEAIALAHNGNLTNGNTLREQFPQESLTTTTDSEAIALLLLQAKGKTLRERMITTFPQLRGAYSLVILSEGKLYAMRDPWGMRPLCVGKIGASWIVASESCAIDRVGGTLLRHVKPGELIIIDEHGMRGEILHNLYTPERQATCVFEYIYFSDATSQLDERHVYSVREALGRELAREYAVAADMIAPVPDTSIAAALGYAEESGIPYGMSIIKNRYTDRSFIKPDQRLRQLEVDLKFNLVKPKIEGKRLVIVDDSIVRGNTMKRLVAALRRYGAKEIHLRSSAPPMRHPCYFGVDIPKEAELIAAGRTVQEVADYIGVDSLGYLSIEGLARALHSVAPGGSIPNDTEARKLLHREFCYGCMEKQGWPYDPNTDLQQHKGRNELRPYGDLITRGILM